MREGDPLRRGVMMLSWGGVAGDGLTLLDMAPTCCPASVLSVRTPSCRIRYVTLPSDDSE